MMLMLMLLVLLLLLLLLRACRRRRDGRLNKGRLLLVLLLALRERIRRRVEVRLLRLLLLLKQCVLERQVVAPVYQKLVLQVRRRMHVFAGLALASALVNLVVVVVANGC